MDDSKLTTDMNFFSIHNPRSIPRLFYRIAEIQSVWGNRMIKKFNLTTEQLLLLFLLYDKDGMSQKNLADRSNKDQANVTRILKRLESKGFLEVKSSSEDKRLKLIFLTIDGREYLSSIFDYINKCGEMTCQFYDTDVLDSLVKSLLDYAATLEENKEVVTDLCSSLPFEGKIPQLKK